MPAEYFSDRENGPRARTEEVINQAVWDGVAALVESLVDDGAFGYKFPATCPDGPGVVGTHLDFLRKVLLAELPSLQCVLKVEPLEIEPSIRCLMIAKMLPPTLAILDLVEFTHAHIGKPIQGSHHSYFNHHHLTFDRAAGQADFTQRINRLFARNGLAYEIGRAHV